VHQRIQAPSLQADVAQPPAEQVVALAEVVADPDGGDLLDQVPVHLLEIHQFRYPASGPA
jgi:hypothetical protein